MRCSIKEEERKWDVRGVKSFQLSWKTGLGSFENRAAVTGKEKRKGSWTD